MRHIPLLSIPESGNVAAMPYRELMQMILYTPPKDANGASTASMMARHNVAIQIAMLPAEAKVLKLEESAYKVFVGAVKAFSWGVFSPEFAKFVALVTECREVNPNDKPEA
jgi:hypothetical protein